MAVPGDPLIHTGFGDGDEYGFGTGEGIGALHPQFITEPGPQWDDGFIESYNMLMDGDGRGYGPRGRRCLGYQFTTTRSFNGHLTNIFLRGLPS